MTSSADYMENVAVVIDPGSESTRAGFAGDEKPRAVLQSLIGIKGAKSYFGDNIPNVDFDQLTLKKPVVDGVISDWESMENLWSHMLHKELQVCPKEHGILMTDPVFSPMSNREKTAQVLFEAFDTPAMYIGYQPMLSLYSYGQFTGLVVDSGSVCTSVSPVYNGFCLPHATLQTDLAGQNVTDYLRDLLKDSGCGSVAQHESFVQEIKERRCYISQSTKTEDGSQGLDYKLPDGTIVNLSNEHLNCPEILFCPTTPQTSKPGIHILAMNSLRKCDPDLQEALMANVVVCGGSSLLSGFSERLQIEMERLAPRESKVSVFSGSYREHSSWVGGSIMACLSSFQPMWVKRQEYLEEGASVVHKKCF
ncbi:actin-1-like [Aplochiton taeniatus]